MWIGQCDHCIIYVAQLPNDADQQGQADEPQVEVHPPPRPAAGDLYKVLYSTENCKHINNNVMTQKFK